MSVRKIFFWLHLLAGVVAGVVILIMSVTGAAIAFEKDLVARVERSVRQVPAPAAGVTRLTLDELIERVKEKQPGARPSSVTVFADPQAAVSMSFGRTNGYVNPYTGEFSPRGARRTRAFMRLMTDWHRWLGRDGDGRAVGKAITGACNVAFLFLAVSGLYLWWPRQWSWKALQGIALFNGKLRGKARDWNWHNVIGLWSAPVLVVLTLSGMIISYRWASEMIYKVTGTSSAPITSPAVEVSAPPAGTKPLGPEALLAAVQKEMPRWEQITLRLGGQARAESKDRTPPVSIAVREQNGWPLFGSIQLTVDPFTGAVLKKESYAGYNTGRKARTWLRFLHTGEALGFFGKLTAALASLGGAVLVWTGLALAWRRFLAWRRPSAAEAKEKVPAP